MTKTEIMRTESLEVLKGKSKTTTAVVAGLIHVYDTDGWAPAGADAGGPHAFPEVSVAAPGAGQSDVAMITEGTVMCQKAAGALAQGIFVKSDANSKAVAWTKGVDEPDEIVGYVVEAAANADTEVMIRISN
jgi:hypothetical protein